MSWLDKILPLIGVLLGGLITSGIGFYQARQNYKYRLREKFFDKRVGAYERVFEYCSTLRLETSEDDFLGNVTIVSPLQNADAIKKKFINLIKLECDCLAFLDKKTRQNLYTLRKIMVKDMRNLDRYKSEKIDLTVYSKMINQILEDANAFFNV
jgi:hypothetical protein